jgi:aminomethyltransferase
MDKETPLHGRHVALNAQIEPFAGYLMPIRYGSVIEEHMAVRKGVGVFDLSHMGEFRIKGQGAREFLDALLTNNADVAPGKAYYSTMCYPDAGIVDDLIVYRLAADEFLMVVNASNIDKDWAWVTSHVGSFDVRITNESDDTALVAIQGPRSQELASRLTPADLDSISYYAQTVGSVAGCPAVIARTGYTGEDGFEFYVASSDAPAVWDAVMSSGADLGVRPIGLAARDTLRLEVGYVLYGNDIDHSTSPLEAKLGWVVKLATDKDFVGRDVLRRQKEDGVSRLLVGLKVEGRGVIRHGTELFQGDRKIGVVTSGTMAPALGIAVGLGYVEKGLSKIGTKIEADVRGRRLPVVVSKLPFYTAGSRRQ